MSITSLTELISTAQDNGAMDSTDPPRPATARRRVNSPAQKSAYLDGYEQAIQTGEGGGYLRANGLYSSPITEWRKLRDAGILDGTTASQSSDRLSRLTKEQAEIVKLKKQLAANEQKLAPRKPPWKSWEKHTRPWSRSQRARNRNRSTRGAGKHLPTARFRKGTHPPCQHSGRRGASDDAPPPTPANQPWGVQPTGPSEQAHGPEGSHGARHAEQRPVRRSSTRADLRDLAR